MSFLNNIAGIVCSQKKIWIDIGNFETKRLNGDLQPLKNPIFITGFARSGTTILLEMIASHNDIATHTYRDFPMLFAPYYWNKALGFLDKLSIPQKIKERSHNDRIMVSPKSPEAMEEILWTAFFDFLHDSKKSNIIDNTYKNPQFANFYIEHIQKLLLVKKKSTYATKNNYNISRIAYIKKLFPDAKILIMVRHPLNHIYSCIKQDKLFNREHIKNPSTLAYMNLTGHFEFGTNKKPINIGDTAETTKICQFFEQGNFIDGWITYWNHIYEYVHNNYSKDESVKIIRYEDICNNNLSVLDDIFRFCLIDKYLDITQKYTQKLSLPNYYTLDLKENEIEQIIIKTKKTAQLFGY